MGLSVGVKVGGGFFLVTLMLIIAGISGFSGAAKLGDTIDYIADSAWPAAEGGKLMAVSIQKQTATTNEVSAGLSPLTVDQKNNMAKVKESAANGIKSIEDSNLLSTKEVDELKRLYKTYNDDQTLLLLTHEQFVKSRANAFKGYVQFEDFMKVLNFYNAQIFSLPNVDSDDKLELTNSFFLSKNALQTRFYYLQRLLGGEDAVSMLDFLEGAKEDLQDEVEYLSEMELVDNEVRSGEFEGQGTYPDVLNKLVDIHISQFELLISNFEKFQAAKLAYNKSEEQLLRNSQVITEKIKQLVETKTASTSDTKSNVYSTIIFVSIIGVLFAIFATVFVIYSVVTPIIEAGKCMRDIAIGEGDLTARLPVKGRDEIAYMGKHFNTFVAKIHDVIALIIQVSDKLSVSATGLTSVSKATSIATGKQQEGSAQIATALSEMSNTAQDVAKNTALAEEASKRANQCVSQSQVAVKDNKKAIGVLASDIEQAGNVIQQLANESEAVGNILNVIRGIAEQTNLLALNAAIEAARAGEQGRGFAVVADEVRTLAQRTQESTTEIQGVIEGLQNKSKNAIKVMDGSRERVDNSVLTADKVNELLAEVTKAVTSVLDMNMQIATAAEEQVAVTDEINRNVDDINNMSQETAAKTKTEADNVTALVEKMHELTGQFKV